MNEWVFITVLTCAYGGLKSVTPTSHFLTQYLEGPWINLTHSDVNNQVYPVWTYSYLCFLPVVFITTIYFRQKPIIILESICLSLTWILLLWVRKLWAAQLMQVVYGLATASEIGYDTYIYAKVPREKYRQATSYTRAAVLTGKLLSAVSAQLVISTRILDYHSLSYISLTFSLCAGLFALFLPSTKTTGFDVDLNFKESENAVAERLNPNGNALPSTEAQELESAKLNWIVNVPVTLWQRIKKSYSERSLVQWSVWWALGLCGSLQVGNYIQPLWEEIYPLEEHQDIYNGVVDAIKMLLGTFVTLLLGHVRVNWSRYGELTMGAASALDACFLFIMSHTRSILVAYVMYCVFRVSHQMLLTIASFQVAKELSQTNQPLVFGCNTFLALIFQTILTAIVVDKRALGLTPRLQFTVYAVYFSCISFLFWSMAVGRLLCTIFNSEKKKTAVPTTELA